MQPVRGLVLAALFAGLAVAPAAAQGVMPGVPDQALPGGAFLQPQLILPQGGCIWNNAVYSDGAIIERQQLPRTVFRCVEGSWQSFDSFDAARSAGRGGDGAARPSAVQRRPRGS
jgi:hypothetical protein